MKSRKQPRLVDYRLSHQHSGKLMPSSFDCFKRLLRLTYLVSVQSRRLVTFLFYCVLQIYFMYASDIMFYRLPVCDGEKPLFQISITQVREHVAEYSKCRPTQGQCKLTMVLLSDYQRWVDSGCIEIIAIYRRHRYRIGIVSYRRLKCRLSTHHVVLVANEIYSVIFR